MMYRAAMKVGEQLNSESIKINAWDHRSEDQMNDEIRNGLVKAGENFFEVDGSTSIYVTFVQFFRLVRADSTASLNIE